MRYLPLLKIEMYENPCSTQWKSWRIILYMYNSAKYSGIQWNVFCFQGNTFIAWKLLESPIRFIAKLISNKNKFFLVATGFAYLVWRYMYMHVWKLFVEYMHHLYRQSKPSWYNNFSLIFFVPAKEYESPWQIPDTFLKRIFWVAMIPMHALFFVTIPDCRRPGKWHKTYPVTFVMSIAWIAGLSYIMVWMVTVAGKCSHQSDPFGSFRKSSEFRYM